MSSTPVTKKRLPGPEELAELPPNRAVHDRTRSGLMASLKTSMEQVLAGEHRPALEVLDEIDGELTDDADNSQYPS